MTNTAPETQTCPFCYTEMDARAEVCPNCLATKDTTPEWAKRLKIYWSAAVVIFIGLALTFIDGKGMNWWGVPFVGVGVFFLLKARKVDVSDVIWHRKE